eukprot:1464585-Rhodomonas_salina.1
MEQTRSLSVPLDTSALLRAIECVASYDSLKPASWEFAIAWGETGLCEIDRFRCNGDKEEGFQQK